ncbi:YCF48-related protein [Nannocystis sp. RBIL2]|uniref:WD40/YVTN/BNR-like repeat-containing protein n=1 Tax=Nannocystis sp. RBIL2 TaxID=2996788 RepID=UPI00226F0FB5|nr:YCF48-related protein [Nannocystis sp. RBIL2]MCY1066064.1 YCF48-related protein [Nannocystis sp. RBIL2]
MRPTARRTSMTTRWSLAATLAVLSALGSGVGCDAGNCGLWESGPQDPRIRLARGPLAVGSDGALFVQRTLPASPHLEFVEVADDLGAALSGIFVPTSPSATRWFAVGRSGAIRWSEDLGETWQASVGEPAAEDFHAVRFACPRPRFGMLVGDSGAILRTQDEGTSWERLDSGTTRPLRDLAVLDDQVAVAVGDGGTLVRSIDGGAVWEPVLLATTADLTSIDFGPCLDPDATRGSTGVIVGDAGTVLFTRDRGATWDTAELRLEDDLRQVQLLDRYLGTPDYARLVLGTSVLTWEVGTSELVTHHRFSGEVLAYDAFGAEEYAIAEGELSVRPGPEHCLGPI